MLPLAFLASAPLESRLPGDTKPAALADQSVPERYRGRTILNKPKGFKEKVVALTFDDGPDAKNTVKICGAFAKHGGKATFFVLGSYAARQPKLVRYVAVRGHVIGSHSWSHPSATTSKTAGPELWKTAHAIHRATGVWPSVFRPPYGIMDGKLAKAARTEKYGVVIWNRSGADAVGTPTSSEIAERVLKAKPGDVVLLHDGPGKAATAKAVPAILKGLSKKGYKFITVPEMLRKWDAYLKSKGK